MGNRKQPFGYKMSLGEIVIQESEAKLVQEIFLRYIAGESLNELTESLRQQDIPYDEGRLWNKNMVARILADTRYTGEKGYPKLIDEDQLIAANEKRSNKPQLPKKTEAQKVLRRLCGTPPSERVEQSVTGLLNGLANYPERIQHQRSPITTGCSAITTTTGPLMKSTYCSGSRSYKLSETGQGREKHGDVTVLFSALSVESGAVRRKGETMNIRKAVDYSTMFATLESVMKADLPQMELYCEIGKAVCAHSEKGAAVAAAEFIKEQYPDMTGFSPRNVRRMRDFWQLYSGTPELLGEALHLNWTQNVVIMEAELPAEERRWYIRQATARNLSKAELLRMIEDSAYLESVLDEKVDVWYNEGNDEISERTQYEEDPVYLSRQYLPQPHGRVRDEGLGKKGGTGIAISYRISGYQSGGDRQHSLSSGTAQAGRAWDLL